MTVSAWDINKFTLNKFFLFPPCVAHQTVFFFYTFFDFIIVVAKKKKRHKRESIKNCTWKTQRPNITRKQNSNVDKSKDNNNKKKITK